MDEHTFCGLTALTSFVIRQQAYRDRQRHQITELRAQIVSLRLDNERLQTQIRMLEAALMRYQVGQRN
jgi:uncharacterized protein YlxW (UPF0749 family)